MVNPLLHNSDFKRSTRKKPVENFVGKGDIYQHFLLFPQCLYILYSETIT